MIKVYLSGPMTGLPDNNYPAFIRAACALSSMGMTVLSPHEAPACESWEEYMRHDIRMLCDADAICMLPGWETSRGALAERFVATTLGLPVVRLPEMPLKEAVETASEEKFDIEKEIEIRVYMDGDIRHEGDFKEEGDYAQYLIPRAVFDKICEWIGRDSKSLDAIVADLDSKGLEWELRKPRGKGDSRIFLLWNDLRILGRAEADASVPLARLAAKAVKSYDDGTFK